MSQRTHVTLLTVSLAASVTQLTACSQPEHDAGSHRHPTETPISDDQSRFDSISAATGWNEVFFDDGTTDWRQHWFLDGDKARVSNDEAGMALRAGPIFGEDASHAVLWTNQSFAGDIKIEYEYTRLDDATKAVNIIYVLATGTGNDPYTEDLLDWAHLRRVPAMRLYFRNVNTYHISYAAFGLTDDDQPDYVRARRYMPDLGRGLRGTALEPDTWDTGLFEPGVPHRITVVKSANDLFMHVRNPTDEQLFAWKTDTFPDITEGRVGLRHMYTRASRYKDFRVSTRAPEPVSTDTDLR
ncbi:MAG: DUF1961 family protein [Planctomycetota bacterium]